MTLQRNLTSTLRHLLVLAPAGYAVGLRVSFIMPALQFQTYPAEWISIYSRDGLVMKDPTVAWGLTQTGFCRWSDLQDQDPHDVFRRARPFGLNYGVTCSHDDGTARSLAGFAHPSREFTQTECETLLACLVELHTLTLGIDDLSPETRATLAAIRVDFSASRLQ